MSATAALSPIRIGANNATQPGLPKTQEPSSGDAADATRKPTASLEGEPRSTRAPSSKTPAIPARSANGASKWP